MARKIHRKLGKICATSKKALRVEACLHNLKCKPKRAGKAVVNGHVHGVVYCCTPKRSLRSRMRRAGRRFRSHWRRSGRSWRFG